MQLPDAGEGMCCIGAAMGGPERCTCWKAVHDHGQAEPQEGPPSIRAAMCGDCAFRKDSPERTGDRRYQHSEEGEVDDLALGRGVFMCHQGMRRKLALVHPSGARVQLDTDDYDPPVIDGRAYKADGSPADLCAGFWSARRRATL